MIYLEKGSFKDYSKICITSNGIISNGKLIMGAGVAKYFRDKYKGVDIIAAKKVKENGNIFQPLTITDDNNYLFLFPTKNHWRDNSSIELIKHSCKLLFEHQKLNPEPILLPLPGCRNGNLSEEFVLNNISKILFLDSIVVIKNINELDNLT